MAQLQWNNETIGFMKELKPDYCTMCMLDSITLKLKKIKMIFYCCLFSLSMQSFPIYLTRDHIGILAAFTVTEQTHSSNNYTENDLQTKIAMLSAISCHLLVYN